MSVVFFYLAQNNSKKIQHRVDHRQISLTASFINLDLDKTISSGTLLSKCIG